MPKQTSRTAELERLLSCSGGSASAQRRPLVRRIKPSSKETNSVLSEQTWQRRKPARLVAVKVRVRGGKGVCRSRQPQPPDLVHVTRWPPPQ